MTSRFSKTPSSSTPPWRGENQVPDGRAGRRRPQGHQAPVRPQPPDNLRLIAGDALVAIGSPKQLAALAKLVNPDAAGKSHSQLGMKHDLLTAAAGRSRRRPAIRARRASGTYSATGTPLPARPQRQDARHQAVRVAPQMKPLHVLPGDDLNLRPPQRLGRVPYFVAPDHDALPRHARPDDLQQQPAAEDSMPSRANTRNRRSGCRDTGRSCGEICAMNSTLRRASSSMIPV